MSEEKKKDTEDKSEEKLSDKQMRIADIAREIFTARCAANANLHQYLQLFISAEEKQEIRKKEEQERSYRKARRERARQERLIEEQRTIQRMAKGEDWDEDLKECFYGTNHNYETNYNYRQKPTKPTISDAQKHKLIDSMAQAGLLSRQTIYDEMIDEQDGPTYDEVSQEQLNELSKIINQEIEMSYFLAKLFVDRRLKVMK